MFETFSKTFESTFRTIFICWVCLWGFFNMVSLFISYASFSTTASNTSVASWGLNTLGDILTLTFGIVLFCMMIATAGNIAKNKKVTNIPLMTGLAVLYYLFRTIMQILGEAIYRPETFGKQFIFLVMWLLPSIILMVIHIIYFNNLGKYNEELRHPKTEVQPIA